MYICIYVYMYICIYVYTGCLKKGGILDSDVCQIFIFCHRTPCEPIFELCQSVEAITIDQSGL